MIYRGTINVEQIVVSPMDNINNHQVIELTKYSDEPMFSVNLYDGENDWYWEFAIISPSDYERVKFDIFDTMFDCDTMVELAVELDEILETNLQIF